MPNIALEHEFVCYLNYKKVILNSNNRIANILGIGVIAPLKAKSLSVRDNQG